MEATPATIQAVAEIADADRAGPFVPHDGAFVVAALDASLDDEREDSDETASAAEIEQAWAQEIQRRVDGVLAGKRQGRPLAEAIAEVRATLHARPRRRRRAARACAGRLGSLV